MVVETEPLVYKELNPMDVYIYLYLAPFGALASLYLMYLFIKYKAMRKQPGDIIFMLAFAEFLGSVHCFISGLKTSYATSGFDSNTYLCKSVSVLGIVAGFTDKFYNMAVFLYTYLALKNSIKKLINTKYIFHIVFTIGLTIFIVMSLPKIGKDFYGVCFIRNNASAKDLEIIGYSFSLVVSSFCYFKVNRSLPKLGVKAIQLRQNFLSFYTPYYKFYTFYLFFNIMGALLVRDQKSYYKDSGFFAQNLNTIRVLTPLALFFIRLEDPILKRFFKKTVDEVNKEIKNNINVKAALKSTFNKKGAQNESKGTSYPEAPEGYCEENMEGIEAEIMGGDCDEDDTFWMNLLPTIVRQSFLRSILISIRGYYPNIIHSTALTGRPTLPQDVRNTFKVNCDGNFFLRTEKTDELIASSVMTVYAAPIFKDILVYSRDIIDFGYSLDFQLNQEAIKKAGENKGGSSGEIFLFSHDNRLLIKTMTREDLKFFTEFMFDYSQYIKSNPASLIGRIFGVFEFKFEQMSKSMMVMVMENVITLQSPLRMYDLKGSTHNRRVLKDKNNAFPSHSNKNNNLTHNNAPMETRLIEDNKAEAPYYPEFKPDEEILSFDQQIVEDQTNNNQPKAIKAVLKDLDFLSLEEFVNFKDKNVRMAVINILRQDVEFMKRNNRIDYSLILAKFDVRDMEANGQALPDLENLYRQQNFHMVRTTDPNIVYMMGIIDYFMRYTVQKFFEKHLKKIQALNCSLDTSSQPCKIYAHRFYTFMEQHLI